jgi:hypothetical protein
MDYYEEKFRESGKIIRMLWHMLLLTLAFTLGLCVITLLESCKPVQKVVTVPEVHEQHHWHTDSVIKHDSVFRDRKTVIRELDSAKMAQYGIQLKQAERAWLVETNELRREVELLSAMSANRDTVRESIPKPYPVYIEKQTWWDTTMKKTMDFIGILLIIAIFISLVIAVIRWYQKKK